MTGAEEVPRVHPESRAEWRQWLSDNHASRGAVWFVFWRKASGNQAVDYEDAVSEALAFGWIDSRPAKLDEHRSMLYFSVRKRGSAWSRPNKQRVERLRHDGLMTPLGEAAIAAAVQDCSWSRLDEVEDLVEPMDLVQAFVGFPGSRAHWDAFPPSARRGILEWIVQAKTPTTRLKRVHQTAELAARNERANQWRPKN